MHSPIDTSPEPHQRLTEEDQALQVLEAFLAQRIEEAEGGGMVQKSVLQLFIEDVHLAEATVERIQRGEEAVLNADEFWRGMDD